MTKLTEYVDYLNMNPNAKLITWDCNHMENFYATTKDLDSDLYVIAVNQYIKGLK